jgi:hypothetical protein
MPSSGMPRGCGSVLLDASFCPAAPGSVKGMKTMNRFSDCGSQLEKLAWYRAMAQRYVDAVNGHDLEGVLACFADDAEVFDPMFERGFMGKRALRMFYEPVVKLTRLEFAGPIRGSHASVVAAPVVARIPGIEVQVITLTRFNGDGLIQRYEAYWGPDDVTQLPE